MGNSEVGHLNLGAGWVVMQDLPRSNEAIPDGSLEAFLEWPGAITRLKEAGGTCLLLGFVSPGGVRSHQGHAVALAKLLVRHGIPAVMRVFTDGRDTSPRSGVNYVRELEAALPKEVPIATVCGRYFAMDRDRRWERVQLAFDTLEHGKGAHFPDAQAAIRAGYAQDQTDEFLAPAVIGSYQGMRDGDGILSFNFRADPSRQLLDALLEEAFDDFDRGEGPQFATAVAMASYSSGLDRRMMVLCPPQILANGWGETIANPDMVGHTGVLSGAVKAVKTVDTALARLRRLPAQPADPYWSRRIMGIAS